MAELRIRGVELGLETTNIKTKDFSWKTSFIYSRSKNEITKLLTNPRRFRVYRTHCKLYKRK